VVVLGLDAPEAELAASFAVAARHPLVKGFAVGRTIFADPARDWLAGRIGDDEAVARMRARYLRLCEIWDGARRAARGGKAA
jgi:5-dehydro-2-deoxygluconokinase